MKRFAWRLFTSLFVVTRLLLVRTPPAVARWGVVTVRATVSSGAFLATSGPIQRRVHPGDRVPFDFSLARVGMPTGRLRVHGCGGSERFDLTYLRRRPNSVKDVTRQVKGDGVFTNAKTYIARLS